MAGMQAAKSTSMRDQARAPVIGVALAAIALAVCWRVASPVAAHLSDRAEVPVSRDGSFILLAVAFGVLTAVALWRRPGAVPALRLAVVLTAALIGSVLAVFLAGLFGGPRLAAWGVLVTWPLTTAVITALITAVSLGFGAD
jgi:hypothetical protein